MTDPGPDEGDAAVSSAPADNSRDGIGGLGLFSGAGSRSILVATALVNLASFAFHLIATRQLDVSSFGALGALVGLMGVIAVPSTALQVSITRAVAGRRAKGETQPVATRPLLANAALFGAVSTGLLLLAGGVIGDFLLLPSATAATLLALFALPIAIELVPKAVLLGEQRFGLVALALVFGAVVRVVLVLLLGDDHGLDGAMGATVAGASATTLVLLPALVNMLRRDHASALRIDYSDAIGPLIAFTGFWLLVTIDVVMARHYLAENESGVYAAISLIARAVMFVTAMTATVALPQFVQGSRQTLAARRALVHSLAIVIGVGLLSTLVLGIAAGPLFESAFPPEYSAPTSAFVMLAVSAVCLGVCSVFIYFHLASRSRAGASFSWFAMALSVVAMVVFHESITQIASVMLLSTVVLVLMMAFPIFGMGSQRTAPRYDSRELWDLPIADRDLTMVIPFYNPGNLLQLNIERVIEVLDNCNATYEIIAVSDGSTDASAKDLGRFGDAVRLVELDYNQGKGAALRTGLAMGRGRYVGFIDADGDVAAGSLRQFIELVRLYEPDIILGSKRHPMSDLHYPWLRQVYSWGYQQLVRVLFHLKLRDTQTGLKLVKREVLAEVLPRMVEKRFAFDLELFVVGRHVGHDKYFEAPVQITHQFTSTVSWHAVRGTLLDTLAIFYRLHVLRYYDAER